EVAVGDTGNQTDLDTAPGRFAGQELLQCLLAQRIQTAEQVQLPGHAQGSEVLTAGTGLAGRAEGFRGATAGTAGIGRGRGPQRRLLDTVERPVGFHIERGYAQ